MANTNCLEGLACPQCGSLEPFYVDIATTVEMTDNGWSTTRPGVDEEWTGRIQCVSCDHAGTLEEFRTGSAAKPDDLCDFCMSSGVTVSRTYQGKTVGIECGCDATVGEDEEVAAL